MSLYRRLFDRVLVRVDAEQAHRLGFRALRAARPVLARRDVVRTPVRAMGLEFPGPLGLAAGFDKNAEGIDALAALGFGFVEVGTVTGEPQPGNDRPRLFRLPADRAVVNRMGFNNDGAEAVASRLARRRLRRRRSSVVLGVNIGKTKVVPESDHDAVLADYEKSTKAAGAVRRLPRRQRQLAEHPRPAGPAVGRAAPPAAGRRTPQADAVCDHRVPLLVKIAPDLSDDDVLAVADLALELGLDGIVATNTTVSRDGLRSSPADVARVGAGGLSGRPLRDRALEVLKLLRDRVGPDLTIIAVGGISDAHDARERLEAGATLLQAYTAFVYEGAGWPARVQRELAE